MALATARNLGNETASQVLSSFGVKMSNDTITRIYEGLDFEDDSFVEEIGIDDVLNRKGQTYFTVIYKLNTHRLLVLLEWLDGEPLKKWLKRHTKVRLVAKDRASAYASAVNEILPEAVQVADRFHLLQNLSFHGNPYPLKNQRFISLGNPITSGKAEECCNFVTNFQNT